MAITIPDAPNIIGSQPVLRQGANIKGVSVIPNFKLDTTAHQKALRDIGDAWALYEEDQNAIYMTAFKSKFVQFASATATDLENQNKGNQARNLYARKGGFEEKINSWVEDHVGPNKPDGEIRIANDALKQRALNWIDSQKISWINHFADYEASENSKYRTTVFNANDEANAKLVLNARTDEEIGNAIDGMYQTAKWQYQGMDNRYIANVAAKKADEAVSAYILAMIPKDPFEAARRVQNFDGKWANASSALTSASRAKLMDEIQKSYVKNGANNYALADYEVDRQRVLDGAILSQIWETDDPLVVGRVQDEIRAEGEKVRAAREKETAGLREREVSNLVSEFNNTKTLDDVAQVMQTAVQSGHPEAAQAFQDIYVDGQAQLNNVDRALSIDPDIEANYQKYYDEEYEKEMNKWRLKQMTPRATAGSFGTSPTDVEGLVGQIGSDADWRKSRTGYAERKAEADARNVAARRATERALGSPTYASEVGSDIEADKAIMAKQDADREAFEKYHNMLEARKASMPVFSELYSQQADGVLVDLTSQKFKSLPADLRQELLLQRQTVGAYQRLVDSVPEVDTILNEVAGYKKMSQASQGVLKRFVVENINKASKTPTGIPVGEALRDLVLSSAANAMVPEEKKLRNAIVRNTQYDNGWDIDFSEAESALVYSAVGKGRSVKNSTYSKQYAQAGKIIDDYASSLDRMPRRVVEDMREDMIQWIIDGNYDQVIYYVRGFSKRNDM